MDITCDAVAGYAQAGYVVFWDGIVGPWFLDRVVGRLGDVAARLSYVVLRPSRETALERTRERDGGIDGSGAAVMFDQFADLGRFERHVVSSNGDVAAITADVRAGLEGGDYLLDQPR